MRSYITRAKYLVTCALMVAGIGAHATSYTAQQSGNWTDPTIWQAGVAPPATLTGNDFVIINNGITVMLDQDETLNGSQAIITVYGTLTGWHSVTISSGTLNGNGTVMLHTLSMGTGSSLVFNGALTVDNLYNSQSQLSLLGTTIVADTIGFIAGNLTLGQSGSLTLADDAVLNIGAGTFSNYQSWHQNGRINLYYTRPGISSMGVETTFVNLHDISVAMPSASDRLDMMGNITVSGALSLLGGKLNLNGHNLTVTGTIASSGTGTLMGSTTSTVTVSGSGTTNNVALAAGNNSIASLVVNITGGGSLALSSDMTCLGALTLQSGTLMLGSSKLTLQGGISGAGYLSGSSTSGLVLNGTGAIGPINWSSTGATVGNLTVNATGANGAVTMGTDMNVAGVLTLTAGYLKVNGKHLTLSGTCAAAGAGAIWSDSTANLTIAGSAAAGMGSLRLATGGSKVHDLELNTTNGSWIALGNALSVYGKLYLTNGNMDLGTNDLTLLGTDSIHGGSAGSYILTSGAGGLWIKIGSSAARMLHVGTAAGYAPLRVHNNSSTTGSFGATAHAGIYANGTSGTDISATNHGVGTSWNLESDVTSAANVGIDAYWTQAMETGLFNRNKAYLSHYTSGAWDTYTGTAAVSQPGGMWSTSRSGMTSFSPFAVFSTGTAPTGVKDIADNVAFTTYPNPAANMININIPDAGSNNAVTLRDVLGNEVANYTVATGTNRIDISQLTPGIYVVSLNDKYSQKIVKQ